MLNLTIAQALGIYNELVEAYFNKNGYGGNVAEIYAYRLNPSSPTAESAIESFAKTSLAQEARKEYAQIAGTNLIALIDFFLERHPKAKVSVEEYSEKHGSWVFSPYRRVLKQGFDHRVHVRMLQ
jgi:hypothetical protein